MRILPKKERKKEIIAWNLFIILQYYVLKFIGQFNSTPMENFIFLSLRLTQSVTLNLFLWSKSLLLKSLLSLCSLRKTYLCYTNTLSIRKTAWGENAVCPSGIVAPMVVHKFSQKNMGDSLYEWLSSITSSLIHCVPSLSHQLTWM